MVKNERRAWRRGGASWIVACPVQWRRRCHPRCVSTDLVHDHRPSFACVLVCCRRGTRPSIHGGCSLMVEKCMCRAYILIWRDQDGCVAHNRCIIDSFECMQHLEPKLASLPSFRRGTMPASGRRILHVSARAFVLCTWSQGPLQG